MNRCPPLRSGHPAKKEEVIKNLNLNDKIHNLGRVVHCEV